MFLREANESQMPQAIATVKGRRDKKRETAPCLMLFLMGCGLWSLLELVKLRGVHARKGIDSSSRLCILQELLKSRRVRYGA